MPYVAIALLFLAEMRRLGVTKTVTPVLTW